MTWQIYFIMIQRKLGDVTLSVQFCFNKRVTYYQQYFDGLVLVISGAFSDQIDSIHLVSLILQLIGQVSQLFFSLFERFSDFYDRPPNSLFLFAMKKFDCDEATVRIANDLSYFFLILKFQVLEILLTNYLYLHKNFQFRNKTRK